MYWRGRMTARGVDRPGVGTATTVAAAVAAAAAVADLAPVLCAMFVRNNSGRLKEPVISYH